MSFKCQYLDPKRKRENAAAVAIGAALNSGVLYAVMMHYRRSQNESDERVSSPFPSF